MEFYESTYFLVLVPSVVITVIFLFFWLFMKETSYDEVLAKQKKDLKLPPAKMDKKRTDKKKNKRKEVHNGNVHESDSESPAVDFDLTDALVQDEEPSIPVTLSVAESPNNVRERRKKEKKASKHLQEETVAKDSGGSKTVSKKIDPIPVAKQPTPPTEVTGGKKKHGQKKAAQSRDDSPTAPEPKVEPFVPVTKKHEAQILPVEVKPQETGAGKKRNAVKKQKIENALVDEPLIKPTVYIPLMDKTEVIPIMEKDFAALERPDPPDGVHKSNLKKLKNEKNESDIVNGKHGGSKKKYENAEVKFKDFLLGMKNMVFTEEEALSIVDLLKDKATVVHETLQKASKGDSAAHLLQEKEKLLVVAKEEVSVTKEQVKQLSQELKEEKQKSSMVEHKVRERFSSLEKEHGALQNKMHVSYQENQQLQLKFQQVRDQLEDQIKHLKQENGILRDAVSSATNQMESKQSSDLNKLRQDYARLMNELTEKNNKLAQEEAQKKTAEQTIAQLKAQQQDAKLRWEEVETYLRKRTAEFESAQQDIQNTLLAKDSEVKSLHSKLTDTMVSKQQLEQKLMQLMEAEKNRVTENAIQIQVQELMEQNDALQTQIQKFHAQMSAQITSIVLRTNKMLFSIGRATRTLITASLSGTGNETEKESEIVTEKESAKETMIEKETVTERFTETMFLVMQSVIEWTESAFERTEDRYHLDLLLIERQKKFHPQDVMAFRGLHMIVNLNALAWINPHLEDSPLCVIGRVTKFNEMLNKCFLPPEEPLLLCECTLHSWFAIN